MILKGCEMTGYTVHTGSTEKFSEGWDQIFKTTRGGKSAARAKKPAKAKTARSKKRGAGKKSTPAKKG